MLREYIIVTLDIDPSAHTCYCKLLIYLFSNWLDYFSEVCFPSTMLSL